jgi:hypothetical protein
MGRRNRAMRESQVSHQVETHTGLAMKGIKQGEGFPQGIKMTNLSERKLPSSACLNMSWSNSS